MIWFISIGSALFILVTILLIRTLLFNVDIAQETARINHPINEDQLIKTLQAMIQYKTISYQDSSAIDKEAFKAFQVLLDQSFPHVVTHSERLAITETAIVYKIKGETHLDPVVLMAHYDVVPPGEGWSHDPFGGERIDDVIFGRGTLDTKTTLLGVMASMDYMLKENHRFKQDIYLAFAADEEINGNDAKSVVDYFKTQDLTPSLVLDEGGAIVEGMFPGVKKQTAMIGTAEKGNLSLHLKASSRAGHASMPNRENAITELASVVQTLNKPHTFSLRLTPSVKMMFDHLGRHSESFSIKMIFANLWLFLPILKKMAKASGGEMLSMFKTTQAFTTMKAGEAINVLPSEATIGINYRLLTGETVEDVLHKIRKIIKEKPIEIEVLYSNNPTSVSLMDEAYQKIITSIDETWQGIASTPYLMMATTDARHYHDISQHVYRFSPLHMNKTALRTIHGANESVSVDNVMHCVNFYINLLKKL